MNHLFGNTTNQLALDHVGHWVPDASSAANALEDHGFCVTPFSEQRQRDDAGKQVPAGAGNHCVMLENGYLEFLTPLAETPVGIELRRGMARYIGMHIAAFATADTKAEATRLERAGFPQSPPVALRRTIEGPDGASIEAAFTVARPLPPGMSEGRFQVLTHHTPEALWQSRWVRHDNAVSGFVGLVVVVESLSEGLARFGRWTGVSPEHCIWGAVFSLGFGVLAVTDGAGALRLLPKDTPVVIPGIAAAFLQAASPLVFSGHEDQRGVRWVDAGRSLGGSWGIVGLDTSVRDLLLQDRL